MEDLNNDMNKQEREGQVVVKKKSTANSRSTMQILGPTISG